MGHCGNAWVAAGQWAKEGREGDQGEAQAAAWAVRLQGGTANKRSKQVRFRHQGKLQTFGMFSTAEEAAWEHDLKRLELGYEDEGFYNYKLQLGQHE